MTIMDAASQKPALQPSSLYKVGNAKAPVLNLSMAKGPERHFKTLGRQAAACLRCQRVNTHLQSSQFSLVLSLKKNGCAKYSEYDVVYYIRSPCYRNLWLG
jgi:hypothetical protein